MPGGFYVSFIPFTRQSRSGRTMMMIGNSSVFKLNGVFGASIACALLLIEASASPRSWRTSDGTKSIDAELISADESSVTLLRSDGKTFVLQRSQLHADDIDYLNRLPASGTSVAKSSAAMDETAVFDTLHFGDSIKEVEDQLAKSALVELTVDHSYLARVGLNGSYRTKQKIGGLPCLLFFDWSAENTLNEITLQTQPQKIEAYDDQLKSTWRELEQLMTTLHGNPLQSAAMPAASMLKNDMALSTHLWKIQQGGSALLGFSKGPTGYSVYVRLTTQRIATQGGAP